MTRIYLFCTAGMSTSMLAVRMQEVATLHKLAIEVKAFSLTKIDEIVAQYHPECILLGPQASFVFDEVKEKYDKDVPVSIINVDDYGMMDGEAVLKTAIRQIKSRR